MTDFKNTVVFLTTNVAEPEAYFKPELIGRLDGVLTYSSLDEKVMESILERELAGLNEKLESRDISLKLEDSLSSKITAVGFDEKYGARPLKNAFNRLVIKPLAKILLSQSDLQGELVVGLDEQGLFKILE